MTTNLKSFTDLCRHGGDDTVLEQIIRVNKEDHISDEVSIHYSIYRCHE
jgi:hypothetical protein